MKIVEVNDNDIYGKVFNGYDIAEHFSQRGIDIKQLVITKFSNANFVKSLYLNQKGLDLEYLTYINSNKIFSVHSLISATTLYLKNNAEYKNANLVHLHQIHNLHLSLPELQEMVSQKPTVISLHDPWFLTGRCVHPENCTKWQEGCKDCKYLETLFPFTIDNCDELWNIKEKFLKESDVDIIVSSHFMLNMLKKLPIYNDLHIHLLPFGIDREKFEFKDTKELAKKKLGIAPNDIVVFFREAKEKGTEYIVSALNSINVDKNISIITCSQKGLLTNLNKKYNILELGNLDEKAILNCYNAADIFLMPSLGESFGMMAVEAMASGLPVVVFDNTALPSVTHAPEVGVLVKNRDSDDLAKKINELILNEKERIRRGKLGKKLVKDEYDINIYEEKLFKIYEDAYKRQNYKINNNLSKKNKQINYNNSDVQHTLYLLKELYNVLFPQARELAFFEHLNVKNIDIEEKIHYSDSDVLNLIENFNIELYKKCTYYEKKYALILSIKNTYVYRLLRKIKNKIKNRIISKNNNYVFQDQLHNLQIELQNFQAEFYKKEEDNKRVTNEINNNLKKLVADNETQNDSILKANHSTYNYYKNLEYKFWQMNALTNQYLYEESLKSKTKELHFNPKVSIVIPAYNAQNFLTEAIDCAINQSYKNIEIIVVNDGSNDHNATKNIALSYGNKIKYFEKENGGVSSALNFGIKQMEGQYFAWLSHDDLIDYNHIEKLVEFLSYKENRNIIPFTGFKIVDENSKINMDATISAQINCNDYKMSVLNCYYSLLQGEINGGSILIKKTIFDECGYFDEKLRITQERDMWERMLKKYKFVNIPYDTASIRVHNKRVTVTNSDTIRETDKKNLEIISNLTIEEIKNLESNIDLFYKKIELFYKMNGKGYMVNDIEKIRKDHKNS